MQANPVTRGRYDDDTIVQSSIDPTKRVGPTSPDSQRSVNWRGVGEATPSYASFNSDNIIETGQRLQLGKGTGMCGRGPRMSLFHEFS